MSNLRYFLATFLLKLFSMNGLTRQTYRTLGNGFGKRGHVFTSPEEIRRGLWMIEMVEKTGLMLDDDSPVLEIGTGWTHFYGIFLHLFFNPQTYLFDVWDNRQLNALKDKYTQLTDSLEAALPPQWQNRIPEIRDLIRQINGVHSFDELYNLMNMSYWIEPEGKLDHYASNCFDLVFSVDVMEHIHRDRLESTIQSMHRMLKPGGYSIHQIGIDDHLTHYAPGMSTKNYVRYGDKTWKLFFENRVQYFNRVQLPEYLELFERNGFRLFSCSTEEDLRALHNLAPSYDFLDFDIHSLQTTRAYIVHTR